MLSATDFLEMATLLPFALFGLFAVAAWWVMGLVSAGNTRAEQRLDEFRDPSLRKSNVARGDAMSRVLERATPALASPLQPKNAEEQSKLKIRLQNAGFRQEGAASVFLGLKIVGLAVGFALCGGGMLISSGLTQDTLMYTVFGAGMMFYLPDVIVFFIKRDRQQKIFLSLPDALDLMVVCVEAGLALDQAMRKVNEEMTKIYPIIAEEFGLCNLQLQMGRARAEVLRELGTRTGVDDVRALVGILIQADKFGSSIAQALRVQSDAMRTRRRQLAEEKAAKTAVKLIFPLVIFIFPGIFVVLVGPAAIMWVEKAAPSMRGEG